MIDGRDRRRNIKPLNVGQPRMGRNLLSRQYAMDKSRLTPVVVENVRTVARQKLWRG